MSVAHLTAVQRALEQQNGLPELAQVGDFLIDEDQRQTLPGCDLAAFEQVFVDDHPDEPGMAVFIAPDILTRLGDTAARVSLGDPPALDEYCVAAEGVSHFLYLTQCASENRPVTLLELELQAEVDKFVHLSEKLALGPGSTEQHVLLEVLFERYELRAHVDATEAERYRNASKVAAKFCHRLLTLARKAESNQVMLEKAREFFRQTLQGKVRRALAPPGSIG